jgi:hypothetical protein
MLSISTGDPSDKSDRDILEAVIGLADNARSLPIGLRVRMQFLTNSRRKDLLADLREQRIEDGRLTHSAYIFTQTT